MAPKDSDAASSTYQATLSGWHVLAILLTAFVVMLLANGALIYIATDAESDFRALIDVLC